MQVPGGAVFASRTPQLDARGGGEAERALVADALRPARRARRARGRPADQALAPRCPSEQASEDLADAGARGTSEGEAEGAALARGRHRRGHGRDRAAHAARARAARARVRRRRLRPPGPAGGARARAACMEVAEEMLGSSTGSASDARRSRARGARARARAGPRRRLRPSCTPRSRSGFAISLDDGRVERPQGGRERGACVRVVQGDSTYYGHVDGLAEEDLLRVAESVSQAVRGEATRPAALRGRGAGARPRDRAPPEEVRGRAQGRRCCARATSAPAPRAREVAQVRHRLRRERAARSRSPTPTARAAADDRTRVRLGAQVVARRDGRVETGTDTRGGHAGFELFDDRPGGGGREGRAAGADAARRRGRADGPPAGRGRQRLRRRAAARGRRPRPRGGRGAEATRASTPAGWASSWRRAVRDRLRRRQPPERVGQRRRSTTRARPRGARP